jgi:HTH-type transcriptional regulator/antitoxin HigA
MRKSNSYRSKVYTRETLKLAEVFPPGDFLRDELEARNWTQVDLARILGRPVQVVNEIINARRAITPQTALELAAAFGTSAELWLNLEMTWQLSRVERPDPEIARRAKQTVAA